MDNSLSDCCCDDSDKPKPRASNVCIVHAKAIRGPEPSYPLYARTSQISGEVRVHVLIDETGGVIWARAVGGHPLLQNEALKATCQWQFTPTRLAGIPVKVNGLITFKFVPG